MWILYQGGLLSLWFTFNLSRLLDPDQGSCILLLQVISLKIYTLLFMKMKMSKGQQTDKNKNPIMNDITCLYLSI